MKLTIFDEYRKRLGSIGTRRALLAGGIAGLMAIGVLALVVMFTHCSLVVSLGIALGGGVVVGAVVTLLFYLLGHRTTDKKIAKKLDAFGLEERAVTMVDAAEDTSFVAGLQRSDAEEKIGRIPASSFRLTFAIPLIIMLVVSLLFAAGCTTVSALAAAKHDRGDFGPDDGPVAPAQYTISYYVYEKNTGIISGTAVQVVEEGGSTIVVVAIPADGYIFYSWVDADGNPIEGSQSARRNEVDVHEDKDIYAWFIPDPNAEDDPNLNGGGTSGSEDPGNTPGGPDQNPDEGGENPDKGDDEDNELDEWTPGEYTGRENNTVIDGKQNYKDVLDREQEEKDLNANETLPDDLKDLVSDYLGILDP